MTKGELSPQALEKMLLACKAALAQGDRARARRIARRAIALAPESEAAWLYMAAAAEDLNAGLAYAARALEINPKSAAAHKAVEWCMKRIPRQERRVAAREAHLPSNLRYQIAPLEAPPVRRWFSPQAMFPALALVIGLGLWFGGQPADAKQPQVGPAQGQKASGTPTPHHTPPPIPNKTPP